MRNRKTSLYIYLFIMPTLIIFLAFYLVPIVTVFIASFTKWDGFNPMKFVGLRNYLKLFSQDVFIISLKNLLYWSILASTVHVGFGVLVAFIFYRQPFGWKFVRSVAMLPLVIASAAWAVIFRFAFNNDFGILNNLIRIVNPSFNLNWFFESPSAFWAITFTWLFFSIIVTLIVLTDLLAIPTALHEAASIEGASSMQTLFKIDLPLIKNAVGVSIILSITSRISMYEQIQLTSRGGPGDDTMNIPLILVQAITNMRHGYANAASVIMMILGVLTLIFIRRIFKMKEQIY